MKIHWVGDRSQLVALSLFMWVDLQNVMGFIVTVRLRHLYNSQWKESATLHW